MYNEPKHSTSEILDSWKKKDKIDEDINRLKKMNETEKNFSKNINFHNSSPQNLNYSSLLF